MGPSLWEEHLFGLVGAGILLGLERMGDRNLIARTERPSSSAASVSLQWEKSSKAGQNAGKDASPDGGHCKGRCRTRCCLRGLRQSRALIRIRFVRVLLETRKESWQQGEV